MKKFTIKGLANWERFATDEIIEFPVKTGSPRTVVLDFNVTAQTAVFGADNSDMQGEKLVGCSDGMFTIEVSTKGALYLRVLPMGPKNSGTVFFKTRTADHVVEKVSVEKLTSIEQHRRQTNPELAKIMFALRQRDAERDARYRRELDALREGTKVKPAPAPEPVVEPEPEPAVDPVIEE